MDKKSPPPAQVVNLRAARKNKARAEHAARGAENSARHGQTKAEKSRAAAQGEKADRDLDAHRREGDPQDGERSDK